MSKINNIIFEDNFEKVRYLIASILTLEFANQRVLNQTALAEEIAKPTPDQDLIDLYNLNLDSIPTKVFEERFERPTTAELIAEPVVNVIFTNAPLDDNITVSTQIGDDKYMIQIYTGSKSKEGSKGDYLASIKLQRCLSIVRNIIMNPNYQRLGLDNYDITKVNATQITIGQPTDGTDNAGYTIYGKIDVNVRMSEYVEQIEPTLFEGNDTVIKLYDEEKGYYWTINL